VSNGDHYPSIGQHDSCFFSFIWLRYAGMTVLGLIVHQQCLMAGLFPDRVGEREGPQYY